MTNRRSVDYITKLGIERVPPLKAIRLKCGECMGGDPGSMPRGETAKAIDECCSTTCPLWALRFGKNPWRSAKSEAQQEADMKNLAMTRKTLETA